MIYTFIIMYLKYFNMSKNVLVLKTNSGEYRNRTDDLLRARQAL